MIDKENTTSIAMGLDAIFSVQTDELSENNPEISKKNKQVLSVSVSSIIPSRYQPRHVFNEESLIELANSIIQHGIIQPLVVRQFDDTYELIAGERRLRAAKMAGLDTVPVIVCNVDHETTMAYGVIENIQRKNLNPLEEALSYDRLLKEFSLKHEQIAKTVGKSRAAISNMLRLLNLEDEVKALLNSEKISMGHARALLSIQGDKQVHLAQRIVNEQLSVRAVENLLTKVNTDKPQITKENKVDLDKLKITNYQNRLIDLTQRKLRLKVNKKGQGELTIQLNSFEDLDKLIKQLS